jgi:DNA-binding NtrC family response regulator
VLVVDDDEGMRRALLRILRAFDVVAAETPMEALRRLGERPFDVILADYGISPTDGVRLLRDVAATYPRIRRLLMSGFESTRFDAHVASGLVHRVFTKPMDVTVLTGAILAAGTAL